MTSVKELRVDAEPTADRPGRGSFVFTNAYSVFDWGRMPDEIPDKGASLCAMGASNFETLEAAGVPTHYRGVVAERDDATEGDADSGRADEPGSRDATAGDVVSMADVTVPPREMAIDLVGVPDLPRDGGSYDYDAFHEAAGDNYLVPLEIVFRNSVPVGSSLRRRTDPADLGLDRAEWPDESVTLPEPVVEFSTKFEETDRYLDRAEAARIAGRADVDALERIARRVDDHVTDRAAAAGLTHEDGKIECCYVDGEIRVADVVGTFDENRFRYDDQEVSKECLRQYHRRMQSEWVDAVAAAKVEAKRRGVADWRTLCERDPEPLPAAVVEVARDLYAAGANAYLDRELFDAPSLAEAAAEVRTL